MYKVVAFWFVNNERKSCPMKSGLTYAEAVTEANRCYEAYNDSEQKYSFLILADL